MILSRIKKIFWYIELIPKLGIRNVFYVLYYRVLLRSGILKKKYPFIKPDEDGVLYQKCPSIRNDYPDEWKQNLISQADSIVKGVIPYYSYYWIKQSVPPNWFLNPFNGKECMEVDKHWTRIADFNDAIGDIKNIWEASRFSWVGILARAYAVSGDRKYQNTLNEWLNDWLKSNPVNQGPNWKCGQEASIRVLNLLNAAYILRQHDRPSKLLIDTIIQHLERISSNIRYAISQRNNHATSEAAALFIGGSWLAAIDSASEKEYKIYADKGRQVLERLLRSLVYEDGSFAQHSVNYHRLFLDTLTFITFWIFVLDLKPLSKGFNENAKKSAAWLLSIVDESGMCPNLGSNDGTMLLGNHSCDYLDYRPSMQAAAVMINKKLAFDSGPWDETLYWFDIKKGNYPFSPVLKKSIIHSSGYVVMSDEDSWALLRFPYYKFRPSHNDIFHFDLWANGRNLLFDSGSFSYNPEKDSHVPDLKSVHSHNTLSFDKCEQMPRLGRFLLGKWLKYEERGDIERMNNEGSFWEGSYRVTSGNVHIRKVSWHENNWVIHDRFTGKSEKVELGFNFDDDNYSLENNILLLSWGKLTISDNASVEIIRHWISNYYMQSRQVYRLVVNTENNSEIVTSINIFK